MYPLIPTAIPEMAMEELVGKVAVEMQGMSELSGVNGVDLHN